MTASPIIKIDGQRRLNMPVVVLLAILTTVFAWGAMANRVATAEETVKNSTARLTAIEHRMDTDISEIKTNLLWLKEREQARGK